MKKILVCLSLFLLLAVGCTNTMNTPTKKVEELLGKYQKMDSTVLAQLDSVISEDVNMSDEQKKEYRSLMEKQYQNLSYKVQYYEIKGNYSWRKGCSGIDFQWTESNEKSYGSRGYCNRT